MIESKVKVLENRRITKNFYLMKLSWTLQAPLAGQFINLEVPCGFLKRPFSVFDYEDGQLCILYKIVGKATRCMSGWRRGFETKCLGPLGNPFVVDDNIKILVGGGTGIAPFYYFLKRIKNAYVFLGFSSGEEASFFYKLFSTLSDKVFISTTDGLYGFFKGNVIELLGSKIHLIDGKKTLYSCGPIRMLSSLKKFVRTNGIEKIWVSLEERMGCGFGACLGCAVKTKDNTFLYVCKDGPSFLIENLEL